VRLKKNKKVTKKWKRNRMMFREKLKGDICVCSDYFMWRR